MSEALPPIPDVQRLVDEYPCGLLVTSVRGTILRVNETLCRWIGWSADDLIQKKRLQELFTVGGRIFHQTHWSPTLQMQGSVSEVKFDVVHKDGHTLPMMLNAVRRTIDGHEYEQVALIRAEERNRYELELLLARQRADNLVQQERSAQQGLVAAQSRLLQAVRIGSLFLWDVDPESGERRFDAEVARLLGYPTPRPIGQSQFGAAIAFEDAAQEERAFRSAMADAGRVHTWKHGIDGIDGVRRFVTVSGQALLNEEGTLAQFVGVLHDVTESVRDRSMALDRALFAEQMVGIVSHDLRNPLSAIMAGTAVLALPNITPEARAKSQAHIVSSAQRARRLIDDLLDFTMARVGRGLSVSRQPIDLHQLVGRIVDELALAFAGSTIRHVRLGQGACEADPDRIAQLVGNLVANAISYGAPQAGVTVTSELSGTDAVISVHNAGDPIPSHAMSTIFEPMVRGVPDNSINRSVGLGLFIVRAIAYAHKGDVTVTSSLAEGTTFAFRFSADARQAK